ncbi:hypothetical protein [Streptomyces sp. HC307]|uniref:hypothetical protein n=1 Tax=Streptomyces flavusporus TaxID=3385496 RepID=UPI003917137A
MEVTDARGDLYPQILPPDALLASGRGLSLVAALADHWDCVPCPSSGKTARAELSAPPSCG